MVTRFPVRYRDATGEISTLCTNDGQVLRLQLDGVDFEGTDFDGLAPVHPDPSRLARFTLVQGSLADCTLETHLPLVVCRPEGERACVLKGHLRLGRARANGGLDEELLQLSLTVDEHAFVSSGRSGWYEDALLDLQKQLPLGWYLRICFGCAWSDYSPYGHGLFGGLACFRDHQEGYARVRDKGSLFRVWDTLTGFVQETDCCPQFKPRTPGTGYRG